MKKILIAMLFIPVGLHSQEGFQQEIINQEALTPAFRYENLDRTAISSFFVSSSSQFEAIAEN
jgi:hypothetical protein